MDQDRLSLLALHFIPGVGDYLVRQLVSYCGSAARVFETPKGKLLKVPGIGEVTAAAIKAGNTFREAEAELAKAEKNDTEILFFIDKKYPARLKELDDAPALLYYKGNADLNARKSVAIVGTRQATAYGKEIVNQLVEGLKPHGALIVSGLAYGIDIQAHKQSLLQGLPTVAVMGSGMDVIYPAVHRDVATKIVHHGALITENHFGTQPDAHHFPARNRIIAGLCDALIVVEAAAKGGALITAEIANSYNRDVFAVPGSLGSTYSEGCNKLIRNNKAVIYTSVKDLEYHLNWTPLDEQHTTASGAHADFSHFSEDEQKILRLLKEKGAPMMIDELTIRSALSPSQLASLLLTLEFGNVVKSLPGKLFALAK